MRRFGTSVGISLARETSPRFWASLGVEWVLVMGISCAIFAQPDDGSTPVRLAFYEISIALIPVLLAVYVRERRAEIASRANLYRQVKEVLRHADDASITDEEIAHLRQYVERAPNSLEAANALTAFFPAAALTGGAIALFVVATGSSSTFSYGAVLMAVGVAAIGAVMATASGFSRTTR